MLLIKTDNNGNLVWEKQIPVGHAKEEYTNTLGIDEITDGGYIIAGEKIVSNDKDAWLVKTATNGNILWDMTIGGAADEYSCGVAEIDDEHIIVVGSTKSYGAGGNDVWLIKVSQGNGTLPPLIPTLTGTISGKVNTDYPYTSITTDPEGDQVLYWFDWADGTNSGWLGPYDLGEEVRCVSYVDIKRRLCH